MSLEIKIKNVLNLYFSFFRKKIKIIEILKHNGISIDEYPEKNWYLIPYPKQKGKPYNFDNLTTANKHSFITDFRFNKALKKAEMRWLSDSQPEVRNISWRLHVMFWSISTALQSLNSENEIFIECGTGKGYMAAGICDYFDWDNKKPIFYLVDSFKSTMPDSDGKQTESGNKLFVYADGDEEVRNYFKKYDNIEILTGYIPQILNNLPAECKIRFLHLDLNSSLAEEAALEYLKNKFIKGTVILFDDYGGFGGNEQALIHEKFAKIMNRQILALPTGQALIVI